MLSDLEHADLVSVRSSLRINDVSFKAIGDRVNDVASLRELIKIVCDMPWTRAEVSP